MGLVARHLEENGIPTVIMPLAWAKGDDWKKTVFTTEQPFLSENQIKNWEVRKQRYRDQKAQS